jgi:branched-chain amino acid transport system permease protein
VEAAAWLGSGLVCGMAGLLLSNLVGLDIVSLSFLVIPALAAALIGQLRSLPVTLVAGFVIGIVQSCLTPFNSITAYLSLTPFVLAIVALLWFARRRQVLVRT